MSWRASWGESDGRVDLDGALDTRDFQGLSRGRGVGADHDDASTPRRRRAPGCPQVSPSSLRRPGTVPGDDSARRSSDSLIALHPWKRGSLFWIVASLRY